MTAPSTHILGELRGLLARPPSFDRDAALCEFMAFHSRVELEQTGAWQYVCAASDRGTLGAVWDYGAWCDVREGRLWGQARPGVLNLRGTAPLKAYVLDELIAHTHKVPCVSLDLGYLGESLIEVLDELLMRADLSRLVWLDLSNDAPSHGVIDLLSMHELPALRSLELKGLDVHDIRELPALGRIIHLGVADCMLDDAWMRRHITPEVMPALRSLDVNHTYVSTAVWAQLGEQHGYEQMYALKVRGTSMTSQDLGLCRWLPCLPWIDTIALDLQGDLRGAVHEDGLELLEDGLAGVRSLEVVLDSVAEDVQAHTLERLAHLPYYGGLCVLGLGGIWINSGNLDALRVTREVGADAALRRFALWRVQCHKDRTDHIWPPYFEPLADVSVLTSWARLSKVQSFELELMPQKLRAYRYDDEEWLLECILAMTNLERVVLSHLTHTEVSGWFELWKKSKAITRLDTLEMHACDLRLWNIERIDPQSISGPSRWVFDGSPLEERALLLSSFSEAIARESRIWPWFNHIDLERVGHDTGVDDVW